MRSKILKMFLSGLKRPSVAGGRDVRCALAQAALEDGRVAEARAMCEELVTEEPGFFDAIVLLAEIAAAASDRPGAIALYSKAIVLNPADARAHYKQGNLLKDCGELEAAVRSYDRAIDLDAGYAVAFCNRGAVLQRLNRRDEALADYEHAISLNPEDPLSHYNRGALLREMRQFNQALESFGRALILAPNFAGAFCNRGTLRQELKEFDAALVDYDRAIDLDPRLVQGYFCRGTLHHELKNYSAALQDFTGTIQLDGTHADAYCNRGVVLGELGQWYTALIDLNVAIELNPKLAEAHSNRGDALLHMSQLTAAVASYDQAIWLKPEFAEAHNNRSGTLLLLKQIDAAIAGYDRALALKPEVQYGRGMRRYAKMYICDWSEIETDVAAMTAGLVQGATVSPPFPILALVDSPWLHRKSAQLWTTEKFPSDRSLPAIARTDRASKVRLGYFSADFCDHPVAALAAGFLELHDRSKFEVIAFSFGPDTGDAMRHRLKNTFDRFVDVRVQSDREVCLLSRSLGIDIAIDLCGHTGGSRTGIFALRAAPIQINFLGYPGTMGADYIDYIVGDGTVVPEPLKEHYSEKIISLPHAFLPHDSRRDISGRVFTREEARLPSKGFVYCCFNNNYKIRPEVFDIWMRILNRTRDSVLWLARNDSSAAANLQREAAQRGVDPGRLVFAERLGSAADHLARHSMAGLFLDTSPYNAHATALDALWSGLPLLTCIGQGFAGRVAASLLKAIGLPELITSTTARYEDLAVELAVDPQRLAAIRRKLEQNRLTTPLFDTVLYTRNLERAYALAFERYQAGLPPDHIFPE